MLFRSDRAGRTYYGINHLFRKDVINNGKGQINAFKFYIAFGMCSKSREANHNGYCQKCNKYIPRVRERHKNLKKEKLEKIRKNDDY